jgi:hypothetical protein
MPHLRPGGETIILNMSGHCNVQLSRDSEMLRNSLWMKQYWGHTWKQLDLFICIERKDTETGAILFLGKHVNGYTSLRLKDYQSNIKYLIDPHCQSKETPLPTDQINMTIQQQ